MRYAMQKCHIHDPIGNSLYFSAMLHIFALLCWLLSIVCSTMHYAVHIFTILLSTLHATHQNGHGKARLLSTCAMQFDSTLCYCTVVLFCLLFAFYLLAPLSSAHSTGSFRIPSIHPSNPTQPNPTHPRIDFEHFSLYIQKHLSLYILPGYYYCLWQSVISTMLHASLMPLFWSKLF